MLEGKTVNLRVMEKDDLPLFVEWVNKPEVFGEYNPLHQMSKTEAEKMLDNPSDIKPFIIEKKDGSKIGFIVHFHVLHLGTGTKQLEIGYSLIPSERGKGFCSEAVKIMVDYLFLSKDIMRIQAQTDQRNGASQKVLEKAGFKKEGILRKNFFMRGEWTDDYIYSIIREEWKEPKILTKTT
ncbi:MAG: GNAT family protein [Candidatus Bathyarchaeia archaeon]